MDALAAGLGALQAKGVVVLFRPFHEFNGNWFWWGNNNSDSDHKTKFIALWRHVFDYLTQTKNLHNLLFVWSGTAAPTSSSQLMTAGFLPDSTTRDYVDIVAFDHYHDQAISGTTDYPRAQVVYNSLVSLKPGNVDQHPVAYSECGHEPDSLHQWDNNLHIEQMRSIMPTAIYFMNWSGPWSIHKTAESDTAYEWAMMHDDWTFNAPDDGASSFPLHNAPTW